MSTEDENPDLHTFIEPELEARVVAWVLGEASAFEAAELERLTLESPELAIFKRRIEAVHGLVREAAKPLVPAMRLAPERRRKVLEAIGGAGDVAEVAMTPSPPRRRSWVGRLGPWAAACAVVGLLFALFGSVVFFREGVVLPDFQAAEELVEPPDFIAGSGGEVSYFGYRDLSSTEAQQQQMPPSHSFEVRTAQPTTPLIASADPIDVPIPRGQDIKGLKLPTGSEQDVLSSPNVTVRSGAKADIEVIRDLRYPEGPRTESEEATGSPVGETPVTSGLRTGELGISANSVDALLFTKEFDEKPDDQSVAGLGGIPLTGRMFKESDELAQNEESSKGRANIETAEKFVSGELDLDVHTNFISYGHDVWGGDWKNDSSPTFSQLEPSGGRSADDLSDLSFDWSLGKTEVASEARFNRQASNGKAEVAAKLKEIIIPKLQFRDATVAEALEFLKQKSVELDTNSPVNERGVNIVNKLPDNGVAAAAIPGLEPDQDSPVNPAEARITLDLSNIPLSEAVRYVANLASLKTKVGVDGIEVVPLSEPTDTLATKELRLPPSVVNMGDAREILEKQGVTFPAGASAEFLPESNRLIVRNTPENLDLVETIFTAMSGPEPLREISAATEPVSTFSLHVSDVSFKLAQAALAKGELPDPARIRPEEFYNAFDYGDPASATGEEVACRIEQSADPVLQQRNLVRIAMEVAATGRGAGQSLRLTVLLDTSGSMERADRVASVRRAMEVLASLLGPDDRVTVIGFARQPRLLADQLPGDQAAKLVEIVSSTPSEGGTNLEEALKLAGEMARKTAESADPTAQNRIVLVTDGAANLGSADPARLAGMIAALRRQGIAFDACGVGADGLDDAILESLTRKGDGRYYLLDRPEDADEGFAQKLAGAFRPAAENVKVQVRFNPARVGKYRLLGFEKHRLREEDFRNDKVDAAELAAEEAAVALYQVEVLADGEGELGEVFVRFRDAATGAMVERSWTMPYDAQAPAFDRARPSMQLAGVAAMLAEKLRGGAMGSQVDLETLAPVVNGLRGRYADDPHVRELVAMFEQMRRMGGE